jgi:hypothetical protein
LGPSATTLTLNPTVFNKETAGGEYNQLIL